MGWKAFSGFIFLIIVVALLGIYWFVPLSEIEFGEKIEHSNFNINSSSSEGMQFYSNMRYSESRISYKIDGCTLQKKEDMEKAFKSLEDLTILEFYPVSTNEEISVTCDSKAKFGGRFFIAGEGGPVNITQTDNFNIITKGGILLIKQSQCENPNVAMHELLHSLGFGHSANPNNIMYNLSKCKQTIGNDILQLIDLLYSFPSNPDLSFDNVSAIMNGKYLDAEVEIRNNGLSNAGIARLLIYADDKLVKEVELEELEAGYGKKILLTNIWITQISVSEFKFVIESDFDELDKVDNTIILQVKK